MSQLLKQCLCPTTWKDASWFLFNASNDLYFNTYMKYAYRNGWCYYRLYPRYHDCENDCMDTFAVYMNDKNINNHSKTIYTLCTQCKKSSKAFMQLSCESTICDMGKIRPHIINICSKCVKYRNNPMPYCFWNIR